MSQPQVRVRLLGSVEAAQDGASVPVRGARRQAVLALLALHRGTVISVDRLVDVVWDGHGPATAGNTLQSHVVAPAPPAGRRRGDRVAGARLRADPRRRRGRRRGGGVVDPAGRRGRARRGAGDLAAALALWRGEPLADLAGVAGLADEVARLDGLWLRAKLAWIDAVAGAG
jgi:hypothetical protein